jgi:hypothetical protein
MLQGLGVHECGLRAGNVQQVHVYAVLLVGRLDWKAVWLRHLGAVPALEWVVASVCRGMSVCQWGRAELKLQSLPNVTKELHLLTTPKPP